MKPRGDEKQPFDSSSLPAGFAWRSLAASSAMHALAMLALAVIPIVAIREWRIPERNMVVHFVVEDPPAPPAPPVDPTPLPAVAQRATDRVRLQPAPPTPTPSLRSDMPALEKIEAQKTETSSPLEPPRREREVRVARAGFDASRPETPPIAKREMRAVHFSTDGPAVPRSVIPVKNVRTGGFGDPTGIEKAQAPPEPAGLPRLGAFDLPASGSAAADRAPGKVRRSGFGNEIAATGTAPAASGSRASIRQSGFAETTLPPEPVKRRARRADASIAPLEIVSKPRPPYTEQARQSRVEGEVVLEVLFHSTGRVEVLRIVNGLGHGLDESAARAAEQILFKPARRDGQPVDSTVIVRMVFQLT